MPLSTYQPAPPTWWRRAVVYEIYIRSFADSDGDGVGDIGGIRHRLPYLRDLGVDAIWITPWYPSPMVDGGYDVADYRSIDPRLGSLDDARDLISDAHSLGIRVILDIVPNHTSAEHPWFREALASERGSAARDRYLFRDGRGPGGDDPPNNWQSVFGGSAWTPAPDDGRLPRQWYLHLFDSAQPDLNWEKPGVRAEFESILEFWLDLGADGFRIDVASFLTKQAELPDIPEVRELPPGSGPGRTAPDATPRTGMVPDPPSPAAAPRAAQRTGPEDSGWAGIPFQDLEGVHAIYRRWRLLLDRHGSGAVLCGEIALPADRIARYLRPDELHTAFNFDFALRPWSAAEFRASIDATLASHSAVAAPATWVVGNHDLPRPAFRYGRAAGRGEAGAEWNAWARTVASDQARGTARARAAALLCLALPGSAYVYQGEELGLPEVLDLPSHLRADPTFRRSGGAEPGRDGCRIPMPWSGSRSPFGFGPAGSSPWLPQPRSWAAFSVEAESRDPGSMLSLYRTALRLRRESPAFDGERVNWIDGPAGVLWFALDGGLHCAVNMSDRTVSLPSPRRTLLATDGGAGDLLPVDAAEWYLPAG